MASSGALERWNHGLAEPLSATIAFAHKEIPFYRGTISSFIPGTVSETLAQIPVLTKSRAIHDKDRMRLSAQPASLGRFSTGTTRKGDRFLDVQRVKAEDFAAKIFMTTQGDWEAARDKSRWNEAAVAALCDKHGRGERPAASFRVLHLENLHYEAWPTNEQPGVTPVAWSHHPNSVQSLAHLLSLRPEDGGFRLFRGETGALVKLSLLLLERGFDFSVCPVDTLCVYGYLSPRWRAWLSDTFGATVIEVFSMSEFRSVARECPSGGHFHFDELPIVTEVVDPITGLQVDRGDGELLLTSLYPFTQQQPLLRYATGDLVRVVPCDTQPTLGFRWQGRLFHAAPIGVGSSPTALTETPQYLGERIFMDVLDAIPDVARTADSLETLGLFAPGTVGWPSFWIERNSGGDLTVNVRLRYDPQTFRTRVEGLRRVISSEIAGCLPGPLQMRFHGGATNADAEERWYRFEDPLFPFLTLL